MFISKLISTELESILSVLLPCSTLKFKCELLNKTMNNLTDKKNDQTKQFMQCTLKFKGELHNKTMNTLTNNKNNKTV